MSAAQLQDQLQVGIGQLGGIFIQKRRKAVGRLLDTTAVLRTVIPDQLGGFQRRRGNQDEGADVVAAPLISQHGVLVFGRKFPHAFQFDLELGRQLTCGCLSAVELQIRLFSKLADHLGIGFAGRAKRQQARRANRACRFGHAARRPVAADPPWIRAPVPRSHRRRSGVRFA